MVVTEKVVILHSQSDTAGRGVDRGEDERIGDTDHWNYGNQR